MGMGSWKWGLDTNSCNYTFQSARTRRFLGARGPTQFEDVILEVSFKGRVGFWELEMGSWKGIMSKVTDATRHGGRETKVISQGKEGGPYDRLGKKVRKMSECTTWQRTLKARLENQCLFQKVRGTPWNFGIHESTWPVLGFWTT